MSYGVLGGGGLGVLAKAPKKKKPAHKVPTRSSTRGLGALGAITIPWQCWDKPGFKNCQAQMYAQAVDRCKSGKSLYSSGTDCVSIEANELTYYGCGTRICPEFMPKIAAPKTMGGWTFGNTTPNAEVKKLQQMLNVMLAKHGFQKIGEDGKLGKATCGAFKYLGNILPAGEFVFPGVPVQNMLICSAWTNPTPTGKTVPVADPKSELAVALDEQYASLPWNTPDSRLVSLQQSLNEQLDAHNLRPIAVTGLLDGATCGAMRWLDQNTGSGWLESWGQNCKGYVNPSAQQIEVSANVPAPTPDVTPPVPVDVVVPDTKPKFTGASMVAGLAVMGVASAVVYVVGKKKGWF